MMIFPIFYSTILGISCRHFAPINIMVVPPTAAPSIVSTKTGADNNAAAQDEDAFGDDDDNIAGINDPRRRIVLANRTSLLLAFIAVTIASVCATVYTSVFFLDEYDYPPTDYSNDSLKDTLYALTTLTIVTPIGFVILKFRITNILIGVLFLFLLVFCLIFPAKGITEGIYSLKYDKENTIHNFAKNPTLEKKIHNFWAVFQEKYSCCGTKEIDRIEDWPYFLNSTDFPASCCTETQRKYAESLKLLNDDDPDFASVTGSKHHKPELDIASSYCGLGLAKTRTRGLAFNSATLPKRLFSGFFLSLTGKQKDKLYAKLSKGFHYPERSLIEMLDILEGAKNVEVDALGAFKRIWKNYYIDSVCNFWDDSNAVKKKENSSFVPEKNPSYCTKVPDDYDNDLAYPSDLNHTSRVESIGVVKNLTRANETCMKEGWPVFKAEMEKVDKAFTGTAADYCGKILPETRQNVSTFGRELLLQMDYLTSYIYEFGKPIEGPAPQKNDWLLWPVQTRFDPNETYPYKLNANYLRVAHHHKYDEKLKQMYYFSRGISENFLLQSVVHEKTCESLNPSHIPGIKRKLARDLNKRWRRAKPFSDWKNKEEGLGYFFLFEVRKITYITMGTSAACIFCIIILAIVFWQYYSRIKAEEYANLALPKEFEVLHLRRGSLIDEADIVHEKKPRKTKALAHKVKKVAPAPAPAAHGGRLGRGQLPLRGHPGLPGFGHGQGAPIGFRPQ